MQYFATINPSKMQYSAGGRSLPPRRIAGHRVTAQGAASLGRRLSLRPPCSKLLPFSPGRPGLTVVRHVLARDGGLRLGRFFALALCTLRRFSGGYAGLFYWILKIFAIFKAIIHRLRIGSVHIAVRWLFPDIIGIV